MGVLRQKSKEDEWEQKHTKGKQVLAKWNGLRAEVRSADNGRQLSRKADVETLKTCFFVVFLLLDQVLHKKHERAE